MNCPINERTGDATLIEKLSIIYKGGMVKRFHNRPVIHTQNNAEHQYMVASIACLLYPEIGAELLKNILWHDIYEYETGDMPWAIKRANPDIKAAIVQIEKQCKEKYGLTTDLNKKEHNFLKLCEYFECLIFCTEERKLGNLEFNRSMLDCIEQIELLNAFFLSINDEIYKKSKELLEKIGG